MRQNGIEIRNIRHTGAVELQKRQNEHIRREIQRKCERHIVCFKCAVKPQKMRAGGVIGLPQDLSLIHILPCTPLVYDQADFVLGIVTAHNLRVARDKLVHVQCPANSLVIRVGIKACCSCFFLKCARYGVIVQAEACLLYTSFGAAGKHFCRAALLY